MPFHRLSRKQAPPPEYVDPEAQQQRIADAALEAEAWAEITSLSEDKQRQHVHYTHVRTTDPDDRQPESFTRKAFYEHLERCYAESYPEPAHRSKSILLFGAVAKEAHAASVDSTRDQHHHATAYCSRRHYWNKVARISHQKYRVKLHAAPHDGYYSMYSYITQQTARKPLSELDQEIYLSKDHPRGEALRKLLEAGAVQAKVSVGRKRRGPVGADATAAFLPGAKRIRLGDVFSIVVSQGVRSVVGLQRLACERAHAGDARLAEFCTAMGDEKLKQTIQNALDVLAAPQASIDQASTRMDLLRRAAVELPCSCSGRWIPGAVRVLANNGEDIRSFCADVCLALELGARRGTNVAIIGKHGSGKSMLFEPFDGIFKVMGKPQKGSTFPFAGAIGASVLVWQDWKHDDATVQFEDLLSFFVGERIDVRVPRERNVSFRNTSPLFFTSNSFLKVTREDTAVADVLNAAMSERFKTRTWRVPLPMHERDLNFPRCSRCCASFFLMHR